MEKRFSDIILPPTLFYQTCTEAHRHTYTSAGTLLLFSVMSTHCIHVIYQAFFICELSFSTQYLQIEKQAERFKVPLHSSPRKGCYRDLNPQPGFRVQAPNHDAPWQKIFENYTCHLFIKICLSPESSCSKSIYLLCLKLSKNSHIFKSVKWLHHTLKWLIKS